MVIFHSYVNVYQRVVFIILWWPGVLLGTAESFLGTAGATSFRFLVDQGMGEPLNNYAAWLEIFDGFLGDFTKQSDDIMGDIMGYFQKEWDISMILFCDYSWD